MKKILGSLLILLAITLFSSCELIETTGNVKVVNQTGYSIVVDVNDGTGDWQGERTVYNGNSVTYTDCEIGTIDGVARYVGYSTWFYSASRTLESGGTVIITWTPTYKSSEIGEPKLYELVNGEIFEGLNKGRYSK